MNCQWSPNHKYNYLSPHCLHTLRFSLNILLCWLLYALHVLFSTNMQTSRKTEHFYLCSTPSIQVIEWGRGWQRRKEHRWPTGQVFFVCCYHDFSQASYEVAIIIPIKKTHTQKQNKTKKWSSEKVKDFPSVTQLVNSQYEI